MVRERLVEIVENLAPTPIAWIAIVVGVFVHFIGFFLFRIQVPGFSDFESPEAYVSFVELDESEARRDLRDQALLSDSKPLFLPSEFDYGWELMQPGYYLENQNSSMLRPFSYAVALRAEDVLKPDSGNQPTWSAEAMLAPEVWEHFRTLGQTGVKALELPGRFGVMEFQKEDSREMVSEFLFGKNPIDADLSAVFWRPATVLVYVGIEGSVGAPLIRESTGIVALDQFVIQEVQRISNLRLVPVGYYRVVFGP